MWGSPKTAYEGKSDLRDKDTNFDLIIYYEDDKKLCLSEMDDKKASER